jgi:hypothetical protein
MKMDILEADLETRAVRITEARNVCSEARREQLAVRSEGQTQDGPRGHEVPHAHKHRCELACTNEQQRDCTAYPLT